MIIRGSLNNLDEKKQIEMIKQNALLIERINNPKESLQLEAVSQHWSNIKYINNPTNRVRDTILKMVDINGINIINFAK